MAFNTMIVSFGSICHNLKYPYLQIFMCFSIFEIIRVFIFEDISIFILDDHFPYEIKTYFGCF